MGDDPGVRVRSSNDGLNVSDGEETACRLLGILDRPLQGRFSCGLYRSSTTCGFGLIMPRDSKGLQRPTLFCVCRIFIHFLKFPFWFPGEGNRPGDPGGALARRLLPNLGGGLRIALGLPSPFCIIQGMYYIYVRSCFPVSTFAIFLFVAPTLQNCVRFSLRD